MTHQYHLAVNFWCLFKIFSAFLVVPFEPKNCGSHWRQSQSPQQCQKARRSKSLGDACQWAWKAQANHTVFWLSPLDMQTPLSLKPSTKRPAYARKILQIVQVNAIILYPIPLIYNTASLGIDCCLRSASFVFRRMMDVICVIFIELGSIFQFLLAFTNVMDTFHTVNTRGLCLPFERNFYLSQTAAYVG
jgi:hypothetical protein